MPILAAFAVVAPEMLAVEAAAATAAEIAAAEAAAAAAAEAAAATAAQQAAATAATQAAAQQGAQAGIAQIGNAAANAPMTAEAVQNAAMQSGQSAGIQGLPPGFEQQLQNVQNLGQGPSVQVASTNPAAGLDALNNQPVFNNVGGQGVTSGPQGASPGFFNPSAAPGQGPLPYQLNAPNTGQGLRLGTGAETMRAPATAFAPEPPSALMKGLDSATAWAKANPFTAMTGAYMGANALGLMDPSGGTFNDKTYSGPLSRYKLSDNFQAGRADPADFQYTPRRYATGGGIMGGDPYSIPVGYAEGDDVQGYAKGGSLSESITQYQRMLDGKPQAAPARSADVGIYYDQDPDTRYQDALTAAQIRQSKVNQRAYVSPPAAKRPTPMGQLQMASVKPRKQGGDDVEAARGGIMQSYFEGGVTGDGNLNLQIPLNIGDGGGGGGGFDGGFGGYTPAGGGNVNPNTGGGGFGGFGGGGQSQGDFGGLMQGIAGLLGGAGGRPQQMDQPFGGINGRSDMDMFSHGPSPYMLFGSGPQSPMGGDMMYKDAQYRPERDGMRDQTDDMPSSYQDILNGRSSMLNNTQYRPNFLHAIQGAPSYGNTFAAGGITSLGGYAAGGNPRLLKGPGDGMSDNIPATINGRQPARLADGEFVIPADVVSHLGNGSTEAGAKQLHAMMDKVRRARTGNKKQGKQIVAEKYLPKKKRA